MSNPRRNLVFRLASAAASLIVFAIVWATAIEPYRIEVTQHRVFLPVGRRLVVAHISDLHTSGAGRRERALLRELEAAKPDAIVITGDTVNSGSPIALEEVIRRMHAPLGVFAVLGNWEHWRPVPDVAAAFARAGATLLTNDARELIPGVWLAGVDSDGSPAPDVAFQKVPAGAKSITLIHSPAYFDDLARRTSLVLAGHTHGGQVRLPGFAPFWLPPGSLPYVAGWYERDGARLFVSRGIGTSILPIRAFCRPELAIIAIEP